MEQEIRMVFSSREHTNGIITFIFSKRERYSTVVPPTRGMSVPYNDGDASHSEYRQ